MARADEAARAEEEGRAVRLAATGTGPGEPIAAPTTDPVSPLILQQARDVTKIRRYVLGIFLISTFSVVYFARDLLLPIVLAILISLTLSPIVRAMKRVGVPSAITGVAVILITGLSLGAGAYVLSGPVSEMISDAPETGQIIRRKFDGIIDSFSAVQDAGDQVSEIASGGDEVQEVVVSQSGMLTRAATSLASVGTSIMAAMILAMFILASGDFFPLRIVEASPTFTDKRRAYGIVRDVERQVSRYLAAITMINAGLGVSIGVSMWLVGMPMPAVWGAAAFILNFLPYIGAITGILGSAAVAIVSFETLGEAAVVPFVYFMLTTIEGNVVTPMLVGRRLEVNPVAVLVTVMLWVWLWGIPGAFLAVPFLVVLKVICDNVPEWETFGTFLSGDHHPTVHT